MPIMSAIYFCVFCDQTIKNKNNLKQHIVYSHFSGKKVDESINNWIESLISYETELNKSLKSCPKSLPANNVSELMIGCKFCDFIIDCFKLKIDSKDKNRCVCGKGTEEPFVVINCCVCDHVFHWDCVEPSGYSGQEISLYKCINCQPVEYKILELGTKSKSIQRLHCYQHLKYEPFVCRISTSRDNFCNERFYTLNFLETHLKNEHNNYVLDANISMDKLVKGFKHEEISEVQKLIDSCLKKDLSPIDSNIEKTLQSSKELAQSLTKVSNPSYKRKVENCDYSNPNKLTQFSAKSEKCVQQNTGKRPRGRPRKASSCQSSSNSSSCRRKSSCSSRSQKSVNYDEEYIDQSSSSSEWNSDTERIEMALSSRNIDSKYVKKHESQIRRPNERLISDRSPTLVKQTESRVQTLSRIQKVQSERLFNEDADYKQSANDLNINELESVRSECLPNQNETNEEMIDDSPLNSSENESQLDENNETNASSGDSSPFIEVVQNLSEGNVGETLTSSTSSPILPAVQVIDNQNTANNLEPNQSYSDWLTHTKPKKYPYFPQINDEVVYIPYGHKLYIREVRARKLYKQTNTNKYINSNYDDKVVAKVVKIQFVIESKVKLVKLLLQEFDSTSSVLTNKQFTVRYHDMENVIDFIILRQTYESSLLQNWRVSDQFRAIVEDKWWFGTIADVNVNLECAKTNFQSFVVKWANNETELMSRWDLERVVGRVPKNRRNSVEISDEERQQFFVSETSEWPVCGEAEECRRIAEGLDEITKFKESKEFLSFAELTKNPVYVQKIAYPMNLTMFKDRVRNHFYRRHSALKCDIKFIESNARILYAENSEFVRNAAIVTLVCLKFIDNHKGRKPLDIYEEVIADTTKLDKIKYYSSTRPHLNPVQSVPNLDIDNQLMQIFNFSAPSTSVAPVDQQVIDTQPEVSSTNPKVGSFDVDIITLSDDSDEEVPVTEAKVFQRNDNQFFCVFCDLKFETKTGTIDHLSEHLNIKLKCSLCTPNMKFESLTEFRSHDESHIEVIKAALDITHKTAKLWIEKLVNFTEALTTEALIQENISKYFGDYCPVCKQLIVLSKDSGQLFNKTFFETNRKNVNPKGIENLFKTHLLKHLNYDPKYECTLCRVKSVEPIFSCKQINQSAKTHIIDCHREDFNSVELIDDIDIFFDNKKGVIPVLDELISTLVNHFLINSYDSY